MRVIFSIILFLFSAFYFFYAFNFQIWDQIRPGPGFFPFILGLILTILSAVSILLEIRKIKLEEKSREIKEESDLKDLLVVSVFIVVYMFIFQPLGYFISTLIFLILILFYLNRSKWLQNSIIIIVFMIIIYSLFDYLLNTGLPAGILDGII